MKQKNLLIVAISIVACLGLSALLWPYAFTVVPIEQVEAAKLSEAFDAVSYVDGMWESQILPTIQEKAVDLAVILNAMQPNDQGVASKEDMIEVAEEFGLITVGEAHVYMVKGEGQVVNVNTETSTGTIDLLLTGYNGPIKVKLYVGPRIPSDETAVRDAVGFITFGDFKEQTEYGKVSSEINKRVTQTVLSSLDKDTLQGKTLSFYGAINIRTFNLVSINLKEIKVVPVSITLAE